MVELLVVRIKWERVRTAQCGLWRMFQKKGKATEKGIAWNIQRTGTHV